MSEDIGAIEEFGKVDFIGDRFEPKRMDFRSLLEPTKIVCVGLNYLDHVRELGLELPKEPLIFLKPPTSIIGHEEDIIYPKMSKQVEYEAELAVVIGEKCKFVTKDEAYDVIAGYTIFNDVTARDLQKIDGQWTRAKGFDTFAPLGPRIATGEEIGNPHNLDIKLRHNGEIKQDSNTIKLIFDIPCLIEFISSIMTLNAGDIIATGTPAGVGLFKVGDIIEIEIEKIGILRNGVI